MELGLFQSLRPKSFDSYSGPCVLRAVSFIDKALGDMLDFTEKSSLTLNVSLKRAHVQEKTSEMLALLKRQ